MGIAAWIGYVTGIDEQGDAIDVRDPLAETLRARARPLADDAPAMARALLGIESVFGPDLPSQHTFVDAVTTALSRIIMQGARSALPTVAQESHDG